MAENVSGLMFSVLILAQRSGTISFNQPFLCSQSSMLPGTRSKTWTMGFEELHHHQKYMQKLGKLFEQQLSASSWKKLKTD